MRLNRCGGARVGGAALLLAVTAGFSGAIAPRAEADPLPDAGFTGTVSFSSFSETSSMDVEWTTDGVLDPDIDMRFPTTFPTPIFRQRGDWTATYTESGIDHCDVPSGDGIVESYPWTIQGQGTGAGWIQVSYHGTAADLTYGLSATPDGGLHTYSGPAVTTACGFEHGPVGGQRGGTAPPGAEPYFADDSGYSILNGTSAYGGEVLTWDLSRYPDLDGDTVLDSDDLCPIDAGDVANRGCPYFSWSMPETTPDENQDGLIDRYIGKNRSADLPTDGRYRVRFDACAGDYSGPFAWDMRKGAISRSKTTNECATEVLLEEGAWTVTLTVNGLAATAEVDVVNYLIVSLGDSFSSGEGNPDTRRQGDSDAKWVHRDCHRSAYAASALTAVDVEKSDDQTSVTFVHLACSGGTILKGILERYKGAEKDGHSNDPQITEAREVVNGQPVDALILSVGGNDVGFGPIIEKCLFTPNCYKKPMEVDGVSASTMHKLSQKLLRRLSDRYVALRRCLQPGTPCSLDGEVVRRPLKVDPALVIHVGYPNLTKGLSGQYCDDAGLMRADEYEWADKVLLSGKASTTVTLEEKDGLEMELTEDGLNPKIEAMAARAGWQSVVGHYDTFEVHGYCADEYSWIRSVKQSRKYQGNLKGGFHPNEAGHEAIRDELLPALLTTL